jgi:hypothetical protein
MSVGGDKPFGINDIQIADSAGETQADLPAARVLAFNPRIISAELSGDDQIKAVASRLQAVDWELEAGGVDLDVVAIMSGYTVGSSGTTPNQSEWIQWDGGQCFPYFQIFGKALGVDCDDDFHVYIYKAKITEWEGRLQDGQFYISRCRGMAIDDGTNGVMRIVQQETATDLPGVD